MTGIPEMAIQSVVDDLVKSEVVPQELAPKVVADAEMLTEDWAFTTRSETYDRESANVLCAYAAAIRAGLAVPADDRLRRTLVDGDTGPLTALEVLASSPDIEVREALRASWMSGMTDYEGVRIKDKMPKAPPQGP